VKQIVARLGGQVGFDDAPGGGAIFHVEFPDWEQTASEFDASANAVPSSREIESGVLR
jgi:hypothetical protein